MDTSSFIVQNLMIQPKFLIYQIAALFPYICSISQYDLLPTYLDVANSNVVGFNITLFAQCSIPFIEIGRTHCSYKSFYSYLQPRAYCDSQIMGLWTENSNKFSKELAK